MRVLSKLPSTSSAGSTRITPVCIQAKNFIGITITNFFKLSVTSFSMFIKNLIRISHPHFKRINYLIDIYSPFLLWDILYGTL